MKPAPVRKEDGIAQAIELWEEHGSRLARHGADYAQGSACKKVALKKILVGKVKETYELWKTEKLSCEQRLRKSKELARAKKLDTDVVRGRPGVALGAAQETQGAWGGQNIEASGSAEDANAMRMRRNKKGTLQGIGK